ncbi:MAG: aldo/keto reductase [Synergistales bacterium]|nr:aldo/keto reductase [Synergistales bacterium]
MLYRRVPKTGEELSILGYGCMRFPTRDGKIDEPKATEQLRYAIDQGLNYVDTAYPYHNGQSEPFLGRALAEGYRERVHLATKLPPWSVGKRTDMDRILKEQLDRLQTDRIDFYLLHALDREKWDNLLQLGVLDFLDESKEKGLVRNAGFSFHDGPEVFKEIVDAYDWEFCQIQYNIIDEHFQAGVTGLRYAAERDLAVIVMEPLKGGNLAHPVPPSVQAVWDRAEPQRSPAEWGLRWLWNQPEVTVAISGMNDDERIRRNIRIAGEMQPGTLTDGELQLIREAAEEYRRLTPAACTGCRYCMPCPAGVDIPTCLSFYNRYAMFPQSRTEAKRQYFMMLGGALGKKGHASMCVNCGKCLELCPQQLPIPDLLGETADKLEGRRFRVMQMLTKPMLTLHRLKNRFRR